MIRTPRSTQLQEINAKNSTSAELYEDIEEEEEKLPCFEEKVLFLYRAKNYVRCIKTIERILKVTPKQNSSHYKILLAASYTMSGKKLKKSHSILDDVLRENPNESFALYGKGVAYYFQQEFEKSIEYLNKAIAVNPQQMNPAKDLKIKINLERKEATVMLEKLNVEICKDEDSDCDAKKFPESDKTISTPAQEAYHEGMEFYMKGDLTNSRKFFENSLKLEPEYEEAEEMLAKVQELTELLDVAEMNLNEKNYEIVVEIINQAMELVDSDNDYINKTLYFKRGLAYFHMKENDLSLKDYAEFDRLKKITGDEGENVEKL